MLRNHIEKTLIYLISQIGQKWMPRGIQLQMPFGEMFLVMFDFYHLMYGFGFFLFLSSYVMVYLILCNIE